MHSRPLVVRLALLVASALLTFSGCDCGRECTVPTDCPGGQTCSAGHCMDNPDAGPTCSPACPISQFCDSTSRTCKNCDGTLVTGTQVNRGCTAAQPICDTAANNGLGQCRTCAPTGTGGAADPGCFGATPICNPAGNNGSGACVTCSDRGGCTSGRVCDTSVAGGVCRACIAVSDGGVAPGCTAAEPICNQGQGRCLTCTATAGCGSGTICDVNANGGKGVCNYCLPAAGGGVAPGCTASSPVCDPARDGGFGACIICNAGTGCSSNQVCETAANDGTGQCKYCYDGSGSTDPGCTSGSPVCNTAGDGGLGQCVGCLASADCSTPPNLVCDTVVNTCKVCVLLPNPEGCSANQVCDPTANGGQGQCTGCVIDPDCALPDGGVSSTPYCQAAPPPGRCVECLGTANCTDSTRPVCNGSNVCGCASSADCAGSTGTPVCDTAAASGNGICVLCTPTEGCNPDAPFCSNNNACICRDNSDCPVGKACVGSPASCQPVDLGPAQDGINVFTDAGVGAVNVLIDGAYITYLKPVLGSFTNDPPGFFVQAQASGPAMYVVVTQALAGADGGPVTVMAGDRVQFTVLNKATIGSTTMPAAVLPDGGNAVTGVTVLSSGHPVRNLSTDTPAGLVTDVSSATDLVSALSVYQARVIRLTNATVDAGFVASGTDHLQADIKTAGVTASPLPRLRLPSSLIEALDIGRDCTFTLRVGPVWRFGTTAQPTAYSQADIAVVHCPYPPIVQYAYALSDSTVEVTFDHAIDAATLEPTDFNIPGLVVLTAVGNGRRVLLGTTPQAPAARYSVTVSGVSTPYGVPIGATGNAADFTGYSAPPSGLVINEIDYDNPSTDNFEYLELYNGGANTADLGGMEIVLGNGADGREYNRLRLVGTRDDAGTPTTLLPPGGYMVLGRGTGANLTLLVPVPDSALRMTFPSADTMQNGPDGVGLLHYATGTLVDSLFYEPVTTELTTFTIVTGLGNRTFDFREGTSTTAGDINNDAGVLARQPNGADTNNNNADFRFVIPYTPGSANP